jgi:hypothetical protein
MKGVEPLGTSLTGASFGTQLEGDLNIQPGVEREILSGAIHARRVVRGSEL